MDTLQNFLFTITQVTLPLVFLFKGVLSYLHRKLNLILWLLSRPVISFFFFLSAFPRLWTMDSGPRVLRRCIPLRSSHM